MNQIKNSKKFVPKFCLKFYINGKTIKSVSTKKSKRILLKIKGCGTVFRWDKAFLKLNYGGGFTNEGCYYNFRDLESSYRCFTEIIAEFTGGKND